MKAEPVKTLESCLRGLEKEDVERGMVLSAPGTCTPHTEFKGPVYILTKEEGGRHKPFFTGYRPQFYIRTTDVTGTVELPAGVEMVMPGDNVEITVKLIRQLLLKKGCDLLFVKAAEPLVQEQFPKSLSNEAIADLRFRAVRSCESLYREMAIISSKGV